MPLYQAITLRGVFVMVFIAAVAGINDTSTNTVQPSTADFLHSTGELVFLSGASGPLHISVVVVADNVVESAYETFEIVLLSVSAV